MSHNQEASKKTLSKRTPQYLFLVGYLSLATVLPALNFIVDTPSLSNSSGLSQSPSVSTMHGNGIDPWPP